MKLVLVCFLITLAAVLAEEGNDKGIWVLVWSDEFNETTINSSKWTYELGWLNVNDELEYYTNRSANCYIQNGSLVIKGIQENYMGYNYTSCLMKTQGLYSTMYGKIETRAKLPYGQGIWPAFWMLGDNIDSVGWPTCGEIDIMEFIGRTPQYIYGSIHGPGYDASTPYFYAPGFTDDYHIYSVEWEPGVITFLFDGHPYAVYPQSQIGGNQWVFNQKFFILINLAIGGDWPGNPNSTTVFPQYYYLDYVRVYQLNTNEKEENRTVEI